MWKNSLSNRKTNSLWQKADYIKEMEIIFAFFFPLKMLMNASYFMQKNYFRNKAYMLVNKVENILCLLGSHRVT